MNTWKQFSRASFGLLCLVALVIACASSVSAQGRVDKYVTSTFTADYTDISSTGTEIDMYLPAGRYETYSVIDMPFDFKYDNTTIPAGSEVWACSDGTVSLDQTYSYTNELGDQSFPGALCFFNTYSLVETDALYGYGYAPYGQAGYYETDGEPGNRVLTIQYDYVHLWQTDAGYYGTLYGWSGIQPTQMQVKLYEATGVIEFIYQYHDNYLGSDYGYYYYGYNAPTIGINGLSTPSFAYNQYAELSADVYTPSADIRFTPPAPPAVLSLQPKNLNFGTVLIGQADTVCTLTAYSVGTATLHIQGMNMSGAPDFSLISGPQVGDSLQPGQSANFCFRYSPLTDGGRSATFTLLTDGGDSGTQSATLSGVGAAPRVAFGGTFLFQGVHVKLGGQDSATRYLLVTNTGTGPLNFNSIYPIGINGSEYYVSYFPQNPLPAGMTDSIGITFVPNFEGRSEAAFVINSNALNTPHDTVTLLASGILGRLAINNAYSNNINVNFDSVNVGQTVCQTVTLYNPGTDTVAITRNFISRSDYDYTIAPLTGTDTLIAPDQSRQFTICFTPLRNGFRTATVLVTTNIPLTYGDPRQDTSQFTINLTGTGVPYGHIALGVPALTDTALVGMQVCMTDTITNTGTIGITVTGASFSGVSASAFTYSGVTFPFTLAPGATKLVTLCGTPAVRGDNMATLTLTGTTSGEPINTATPLNVVGVSACASTTPSVAFGSTCVGEASDTATITVTNCGDVTTSYAAALSGSGASAYSIVPPSTSSMVAANGTATFYVVYTPTAPGTAAGTLTITAPDVPPMTVQLNGSGTQAAIAGAGTAPVTDVGSTSANFDVMVNNTGSCDWTPGPATVSAPFTYVGGGNVVIPPGGSIPLTFSFHPTTAGPFTQNVTFATPIGSSSSTVVTISGTTSSESVALTTNAQGYRLDQNFPNPFHGQTQLTITIPQASQVRLDIVNQAGEVVQSVMNQHIDAGSYTVTIDANNLASGTYYYSLTSGDIRLTRQMLLVK